mgnify:FL=1
MESPRGAPLSFVATRIKHPAHLHCVTTRPRRLVVPSLFAVGHPPGRYGGEIVSRKKVDIPEGLQDWIDETFEDAAKSDAEAIRMALVWARDRHREVHGDED